MGGGIALIVFGALMTFAVRLDLSGFSFQSAGVIFMVAGVVMILADLLRQRHRRTKVIETFTDADGHRQVHETFRDESPN